MEAQPSAIETDGSSLIAGLPTDLALECMVRVPMTHKLLQKMRRASGAWRRDLSNFDTSVILKERRRRNLQEPSLFLIPCIDRRSLHPLRSESMTCTSYKSSILVLGGFRDVEDEFNRVVPDFWMFDALSFAITTKPFMIPHRQVMVSPILREHLFAVGGIVQFDFGCNEPDICNEVNTVERFDLASPNPAWSASPDLPVESTEPERSSVYAEAEADSDEMLVLRGESNELVLSYNSQGADAGTWTRRLRPELKKHMSSRWMYHSGELCLRKEMMEGAGAFNQHFPRGHFQVHQDFARALVQPSGSGYEHPLFSELFKNNRDLLLCDNDAHTETASIRSVGNTPRNAVFHHPDFIANFLQSTMECTVAGTPAMREKFLFPTDDSLDCLFAVLFF